jgi:seryl-tRNA synthetase
MIDIKIIRTQPDIIRDSISKRNLSIDFDSFLELDKERLTQKQQLETLQALRNKVSKEVPMIQNTQEKEIKISEMKAVNTEIAEIEESLKKSQDAYENLLYAIPNLLDPTTAIGADESQNQVEAVYGTIPQFSFEPKPHYEIGEARGWIDTEKGAEVSGARFWYLKGDLVLLQFAILQYVMGVMVNKGFTPVIPPFLVREPAMFGTGFFPADRNQIYEVNP